MLIVSFHFETCFGNICFYASTVAYVAVRPDDGGTARVGAFFLRVRRRTCLRLRRPWIPRAEKGVRRTAGV